MRLTLLLCALTLSTGAIADTSAAKDANPVAQETTRAVPQRAKDGSFVIGTNVDANALVQWVLRESYLQTVEDLRSYAEKVKYFNRVKKIVRDALASLRDYMRKSRQSCTDRSAAADVKEICDSIRKVELRARDIDVALRRLQTDRDADDDD